jgi:hypothetical protein
MKYKTKVRVLKYQDHPELENKVVEFTIMNSEKIKPKMKGVKQNKKPKHPRMTIAQLAGTVNQLAIIVAQQGTKLDQLATIVAEGFAAVNKRIDKEVGSIKEVLKRNNIS